MRHADDMHTRRWLTALAGAAALIAGLAFAPTALGYCGQGDQTKLHLDLPDDVKVRATKGARKSGRSTIVMGNGAGDIDPGTGAGEFRLKGGFALEYERGRGPTGDFRLSLGPGVGKLRGRVEGRPTKLAKARRPVVTPIGPGVTLIQSWLKLTSTSARRLNRSLDSGRRGPLEKGSFATVSTCWFDRAARSRAQ